MFNSFSLNGIKIGSRNDPKIKNIKCCQVIQDTNFMDKVIFGTTVGEVISFSPPYFNKYKSHSKLGKEV
jgi:hypothetical protein